MLRLAAARRLDPRFGTLKPIIRELLPDAEIVSRPRFSTLRYSAASSCRACRPRSAVVAFSAEQVYALAEMLRRFQGGAAVVMGALSPARATPGGVFQRGEVDYLSPPMPSAWASTWTVPMSPCRGSEQVRRPPGPRPDDLRNGRRSQGAPGRTRRTAAFERLGLNGGERRLQRREIAAIEDHRFPPTRLCLLANAELDFGRCSDR
jgi:ATP-dependent RNA helicase SUPV3L1/SUV3